MPPRLTTTSTTTSSFVSMHTVNGVEYNYVYDSVGNITAIYKDLVRVASYSYDKLGQLTMAFLTADDGTQDVYEYYYDKSGNITNALRHRGDTTQESQYTYGNATWGDLLTKYNGVNISYDAIGNPNNWRNAGGLVWQGRRLTRFSHIDGEQYMYTYNSDGIRTSKQIRNADNALITGVEYIYDGSKLVAESRNGEWMYYVYDETGAIAGVSYNGVLYLFRKNLQGDVTGIYNANGALVVEYTYSPYGEVLSVTGTMANTIGTINPIRYRGYYYDTETGFYYLQTRYYDPVVGRFINADVYVSTGQGIIGNNMFTYCGNNPIMYCDFCGMCRQYWLEGKLGPCPGQSRCRDYVSFNELNKECDDCPGFFVLHQVVYRGYKIRIDKATNSNQKHIHIDYGSKHYSQNFDGSPHDGSRGAPPRTIKDFIKEKFGWDLDKKQSDYDNKHNNDGNGNTSKAVGEAAVVVGAAYLTYRVVKFAVSLFSAPYTGGWSLAFAFAP